MATWRADVFVNSQVGRITTEVEAATYGGARQQIYAKHGDVQSITNLREVRNNSGSSGSSEIDGGSVVALVGLIAAGWAFITFTPWILMGLGGAAATWIGEKITGISIVDFGENGTDDDSDYKKAGIVLVLAILAGGFGFIKGEEIRRGFDAPSDIPAQVQQKSESSIR